MVGIFSRFSARGSHRRTSSALVERQALPGVLDANPGAQSASSHGIEIAVEFKTVERPSEPLDNDQPIQCPLPEPSILNDGRIWKERASTAGQRRADGKEQTASAGKPPRPPSNRTILPSISAPERDILKLLDECNASGS